MRGDVATILRSFRLECNSFRSGRRDNFIATFNIVRARCSRHHHSGRSNANGRCAQSYREFHMTNDSDETNKSNRSDRSYGLNEVDTPNQPRRRFLLLLSTGFIAAMTATIAGAAIRFLRPRNSSAQDGKWLDVAPVANLKGNKPIMQTIAAERRAGWSVTVEEQTVYVLPYKNNEVVSAICSHEGCNVSWHDEASGFVCPCHDSLFASSGDRVAGPSRRGLDPLPSRVQNGILQVQFVAFVNNIKERVPRG